MRRATRQAQSEIADRKLEKSIDSLASVGMLAKKAERFRSREDGDGGSSVAPEPSSQRKRRATLRPRVVTSASGGRRRARDERAPSSGAASVGHVDIEELRYSNTSLDLPVKLPLLDCYAKQSSGQLIPSRTQASSRNPGKS